MGRGGERASLQGAANNHAVLPSRPAYCVWRVHRCPAGQKRESPCAPVQGIEKHGIGKWRLISEELLPKVWSMLAIPDTSEASEGELRVSRELQV